MRALATLVAVLLFNAPAFAQEAHQGRGVWCDTHEQITSFVDQWDGTNSQETIEAVNEAAGKPNACIFATVALYEVDAFEAMTTSTGTWRVIRVVVVAIQSPEGWVQITPFEQFTSRKEADPLPGEGA